MKKSVMYQGYKYSEQYGYLKGRRGRLHRVIWEDSKGKIPDGMVIDHINANTLDNRIENLQCITQDQNNKRTDISKGYQIDSRCKSRPYRAQKSFNSINYHIGMFGTACGAYMANRMFFIGGQYE
tara:strand:+ start:149 stop:523 length:375 start_codon:yes stop_codon:yes gene_type:complete